MGGQRLSSRSGPVYGPRATVLVAGEQPGGRFAAVETVERRTSEHPRHLHHWEDEALYVLDGSLDVWVAVEVPTGAPPESGGPFPEATSHNPVRDGPSERARTVRREG